MVVPRALTLSSILSILSILAAATSACGGGTPAAAVRPAAPTAASGLGEKCTSTPLVVDLPSSDRVAVEAALANGRTLLARHECRGGASKLTLLTSCELFVGYDYAPMTRREEVVRMNDADAVRAQLPLTGEGLAVNLSAELSRGSALDLALVNVGRFVSRAKATYADAVPKGCEGATSFVSAISTGAFAMSVGTRAHARAVAEIFSAGASGESRSELVRATRDGDLAACSGTERTSQAPAQCRAPLRIELRPIDPRSQARAQCEDDAMNESSCGEWMRRALSDKDSAGARAAGTILLSRCRRGMREACSHARMYAIQGRDASFDLEEIERLACENGERSACTSHGQNLVVRGKIDKGSSVLRTSCYHYDEWSACGLLGRYITEDRIGPPPGPERDKLLANLHARGCQTSSMECERYAVLYKKGLRAEGDFPTMKRVVASCDEKRFACAYAAAAHALGLGVPRDMAKAKKAWSMHCEEDKKLYIAEQRACQMPKAYAP